MKPYGIALALGAGVAAIVLLVLWRNRELFNPASDKNIAAQAASAGVIALTGGADSGGEDTLGGVFARIREWLSGDAARIEAMTRGAGLPQLDPYSINPRERS